MDWERSTEVAGHYSLVSSKHMVQSLLSENWPGQEYRADFGAKARGKIPFCHNKGIVDPEGG